MDDLEIAMFQKLKTGMDVPNKILCGLFVMAAIVVAFFAARTAIQHSDKIASFAMFIAAIIMTFLVALAVGAFAEHFVFRMSPEEPESTDSAKSDYAAKVPLSMVIVDDLDEGGSSGRFFIKNGNDKTDERIVASTEDQLISIAQTASEARGVNALCVYHIERDLVRTFLCKPGKLAWEEVVTKRATKALAKFREIAVSNQLSRDRLAVEA
jgi:archaellum component FlaG (FlaF/FlaG flagellin family)